MKKLLATLACLALVLVCGTVVIAGPAQEKGQEAEEKKEEPKKFTNNDLKKWPKPADSGGEEPPPEDFDEAEPMDEQVQPPEPETDPWDSVGVATDNQGRGEAYWRQAMTEARAAVSSAKSKRDGLQSEMNLKRSQFTAIDDPAARSIVDERIQELFDELSLADQALADAEQALRDLEEDARRSGALPGWLR